MERKKLQKMKAEQRQRRRLERLEHVKPSIELSVDRDPQRILQGTQTWNQRIIQKETSNAGEPLSLHTIPHL